MEAKSSSVSTMSAASLATSVPVMPMATPMSACLSAGASLTPSPVMATTWPLDCSASTRRSFCSGVTRAKTLVRSASSMNSSSCTRGHLGAGDGAVAGADDADLAGDRRRGGGVVAGDHLHRDAGVVAGLDGGDGLRPRRIHHRLQAEEGEAAGHVVVADARRCRPAGAPRAKARTRRPSAASASTCAWTAAASSGAGSPAPSDRGRAALQHLLDGALHVDDAAAARRRRAASPCTGSALSKGIASRRGSAAASSAATRPALAALVSRAASVGSPATS